MGTPILGIDFGTTNTSAAYFDKDGKLRVIKVNEKSHVLPSVVWFHTADDALVGLEARRQLINDPRNTVFEAKRFLGRRFQSEFVAKNRDRFAFDLIEGTDGYCAVRVHDRVAPLLEVATRVLEHITTLASRQAGEEFAECVITVPAHATIRQRDAMRLAAEMAGLTVRAMVNEPTAAALYYANLRNPQQTVLIFDLGGGTFDATLMAVQNRMVKVLATGGDAFLGGANFDAQIAEHFVADFQQKHGIDLREDRIVMQRLLLAAEAAKITLSSQEQRQIRIPCVSQNTKGFLDLDYTLTREAMEEMCFQLIERTAGACDDVLERAKLKPEEIDELVFVGGQTRMPVIRRRFAHFKRIGSDKDVHPELGVAIGAALLGRNLARGVSGLADVAPMPINVMTPGAGALEVIPANTPVPCKRTVALEGLPPWQAPIPVVIFEALDVTSIDREIFGMVQVGPEWRVGAPPALQLELGQDFTLKATLSAPDGRSEAVPIVEMGR